MINVFWGLSAIKNLRKWTQFTASIVVQNWLQPQLLISKGVDFLFQRFRLQPPIAGFKELDFPVQKYDQRLVGLEMLG